MLKNGVVINKWSVNSLPDEYVLTDRLEKLPLAQINEKTFSHKVVLVLAWFVFPLLFSAWWMSFGSIFIGKEIERESNKIISLTL